eukprot:gene8679-34126_t
MRLTSARASSNLFAGPISAKPVRLSGRSRVRHVTSAHTVSHSYVDLDTPTGKMRTYVIKPTAPGKYPGIVLFSEIFQVTAPIKRSAQTMAGHGFVVIVPEIYHEYEELGKAFLYDSPNPAVDGVDRGNQLKTTKPISAYDSDSKAAVEFLQRHADCTGHVGVMGFCIGGHLAFRAAMNKGVTAAACFYATDLHKGGLGQGMNDDSIARINELAADGTEMCMIWGRQDPHVPLDGRARIYAELATRRANYTWHEFNGQHAFMRDEGHRYDPELASMCYKMCVDLFRRKLARCWLAPYSLCGWLLAE